MSQAAHLFNFIIKDHLFTDGNKRIGRFVFLLYLKLQNINVKLNENGLKALALLIAESNSSQKDIMVRLIVNILMEGCHGSHALGHISQINFIKSSPLRLYNSLKSLSTK